MTATTAHRAGLHVRHASSMAVLSSVFFFFNDTATTEIYTLSLHDALPIYWMDVWRYSDWWGLGAEVHPVDRKSTRLNSSHVSEHRMRSSASKNKTQPQ